MRERFGAQWVRGWCAAGCAAGARRVHFRVRTLMRRVWLRSITAIIFVILPDWRVATSHIWKVTSFSNIRY